MASSTVEIGAVLTTPGHWPDGVVGEGDPGDWNHTVLSEVTDVIDFVSVHWYAGGSDTTAEDAMARLARLPGELREVRSQIDRYAGADSPRIGIALTEINTNTGGARLTARPNGLFAADAYLTALENGVFTVDWWNTHNGPGQITTVDGETDYGDMGMLSSGSCTGDVCEPAPNTPFHPYYGMKMTSELGTAGDTLVAAASSAQDVSAHAVHRRDGRLSVLLVNKDPDAARTVDLEYAGFTPSAAAPEVSRYARGDSDVTAVTDGGASASRVTVPPYGMLALTLTPQAGTGPGASDAGAPGTPRLQAVTDTTALLSWEGARGAARYLVQARDGAHTRLVGETTGTSVTLRNLPPGSTHTVNVLAADASGRLSAPSAPLTFTTGTPPDAACAVTYHRDTRLGQRLRDHGHRPEPLGHPDHRLDRGLGLADRPPVGVLRLERHVPPDRPARTGDRPRGRRGAGPGRRVDGLVRLRRRQRRTQPRADGLPPQRHRLLGRLTPGPPGGRATCPRAGRSPHGVKDVRPSGRPRGAPRHGGARGVA
ncbi:hypothetical protein SGRIM128S_06976 [Streptomyces griseomycini]